MTRIAVKSRRPLTETVNGNRLVWYRL